MSGKQWEIYASYGGLRADDLARIMRDPRLDPFTQAELLASALATPFKEIGRAHYRSLIQERRGYPKQIAEGLDWLTRLGLERSLLDGLTALPQYSFALELQFVLAKPYLSQDDDSFYIIDNPVRKDKVFKVPYMAPTSWKGSLRHALWQLCARHDGKAYHDDRVKRLFGETRGDDTGQSGRLFFYPTFFNRIGMEIINPHDRVRRVGKNPILFESVPEGALGRFTLLYVPFDRIGEDETETHGQVAEDLVLLAQGIQALFTVYGFGAKTSSGFGLAEDRVSDGRIQTNVLETVQQANPPEEPAMPEALRLFLEQFPDEDFSLKPKGWRAQRGATNAQRKQYMEARAARAEYEEALQAYQSTLKEWEAQATEPAQSFAEAEFGSLSELAEDISKGLAAKLVAGGAA